MIPFSKITCLEDRAQVERRGEVSVSPGQQKLLIEGISRLAVDRSLQVELTGATLVDARIVRRWVEKPAGGLAKDASALRKREHELRWELAGLAAQTSRLEAHRGVIEESVQKALEGMSELAGAGTLKPDWAPELQRLRDEEARVEQDLRKVGIALSLAQRKHGEARASLARAEQPVAEVTAAVELVVSSAAAGKATLRVSYLVPCAAWRPAYRATLRSAPDGTSVVHLSCEAVVWQKTGEDWKDVSLVFSTARPTLGAAPPQLIADWLQLRARSEREKKNVEVSVREQEIQTTGEGGERAATELPGLDDGGDVRLLIARDRANIPSEGQPYRVPLFDFEAPAETQLLATPEKSPLVSCVARFANRAKDVLLAGPVDLFGESGSLGRGELRFTAPGETVKLSFGSQDALRVAREVEEKREAAMLTGKQTITRKVKLFVSNAGGTASRVALEERILVSEVAAVEVRVLEGQCTPKPAAVSRDGIVRFELNLPAHHHEEVRLSYEVVAPSKVAGL